MTHTMTNRRFGSTSAPKAMACTLAAVLACACSSDEKGAQGGAGMASAAGTTAGTSVANAGTMGGSGTGSVVGGVSGGVMAGSAAVSGAGGMAAGMAASGAGGMAAGMAASGAGGAVAGMAASGAGGTVAGMAASGAGGASPSEGCSTTTAPESGRFDIEVDGMTREYIIAVPDDYDPTHLYPVVFTWHPLGGSAQQVAGMGPGGYYGLLGESNGEAILVSPEGLVFSGFGGNSLGWANTNGRDIAFFEAMLERFKTEMCIDESRIFSTGFSFGGMMSYALGCGAGDLVRAIAPMSGNLMGSGCEPGTTPVAMMAFHGSLDDFVLTEDGRTARDIFVERNGCTQQTTSLAVYCDDVSASAQPCSCVSYEGCMDGKPAIWCEFNGGHTPAPNSAGAIWDFFSQF